MTLTRTIRRRRLRRQLRRIGLDKPSIARTIQLAEDLARGPNGHALHPGRSLRPPRPNPPAMLP